MLQETLLAHRKQWSGYWPLVVALVGVIMMQVSTSKYGAGVSPDSVDYMAIARSLSTGTGFRSMHGNSVTSWPPLYPVLLALTSKSFHIEPLDAARYLNAALILLLFFAMIYLLRRFLPDQTKLHLFGLVLIALSNPLRSVSNMVWSDLLFVVLVTFSLIALILLLESGQVRWLVATIFLTALAGLTRYTGVALTAAAAVSLLLLMRANRITRFATAAACAILAVLPVMAWLARNYMIDGTFFGPRARSFTSLAENIQLATRTVLLGVTPNEYLTLLIVVVILLIGLFGRSVSATPNGAGNFRIGTGPILLFCLLYLELIVITSTFVAYDPINYRLLFPVMVPFLVVVLAAYAKYIEPFRRQSKSRLIDYVLVAVAMLLLVPNLVFAVTETIEWSRSGAGGYNTNDWQQSETVQFVRNGSELERASLISNDPYATYYLANLESTWLPVLNRTDALGTMARLDDLTGSWPAEEALVVWYDGVSKEYLLNLDELQQISQVELLNDFADGAIYRVHRLELIE